MPSPRRSRVVLFVVASLTVALIAAVILAAITKRGSLTSSEDQKTIPQILFDLIPDCNTISTGAIQQMRTHTFKSGFYTQSQRGMQCEPRLFIESSSNELMRALIGAENIISALEAMGEGILWKEEYLEYSAHMLLTRAEKLQKIMFDYFVTNCGEASLTQTLHSIKTQIADLDTRLQTARNAIKELAGRSTRVVSEVSGRNYGKWYHIPIAVCEPFLMSTLTLSENLFSIEDRNDIRKSAIQLYDISIESMTGPSAECFSDKPSCIVSLDCYLGRVTTSGAEWSIERDKLFPAKDKNYKSITTGLSECKKLSDRLFKTKMLHQTTDRQYFDQKKREYATYCDKQSSKVKDSPHFHKQCIEFTSYHAMQSIEEKSLCSNQLSRDYRTCVQEEKTFRLNSYSKCRSTSRQKIANNISKFLQLNDNEAESIILYPSDSKTDNVVTRLCASQFIFLRKHFFKEGSKYHSEKIQTYIDLLKVLHENVRDCANNEDCKQNARREKRRQFDLREFQEYLKSVQSHNKDNLSKTYHSSVSSECPDDDDQTCYDNVLTRILTEAYIQVCNKLYHSDEPELFVLKAECIQSIADRQSHATDQLQVKFPFYNQNMRHFSEVRLRHLNELKMRKLERTEQPQSSDTEVARKPTTEEEVCSRMLARFDSVADLDRLKAKLESVQRLVNTYINSQQLIVPMDMSKKRFMSYDMVFMSAHTLWIPAYLIHSKAGQSQAIRLAKESFDRLTDTYIHACMISKTLFGADHAHIMYPRLVSMFARFNQSFGDQKSISYCNANCRFMAAIVYKDLVQKLNQADQNNIQKLYLLYVSCLQIFIHANFRLYELAQNLHREPVLRVTLDNASGLYFRDILKMMDFVYTKFDFSKLPLIDIKSLSAAVGIEVDRFDMQPIPNRHCIIDITPLYDMDPLLKFKVAFFTNEALMGCPSEGMDIVYSSHDDTGYEAAGRNDDEI